MTTKHTPGPWTIDSLCADDGESQEITVCHQHEDAIAVIALEQNFDAECEANAKLIAAAPDMAEELGAVLDWFDNDPDSENIIIRDRITAVLAKAGC